jgi:signal transduction histidine kinase
MIASSSTRFAARDIPCVRPTRIFGTTAFRLTLIYEALFALAVALLFAVVYWAVTSFAMDQMRNAIATEANTLAAEARRDGTAALARRIDERMRFDVRRSFGYLLTDSAGHPIAGNLSDVVPRAGWGEAHLSRPSGDAEDRGDGGLIVLGTDLPDGARLVVGQSTDSLTDLRELLGDAFAWAGTAVLALGLLTSFLIAKALLRRLEGVNRTAGRIIDGSLADRVPERGSGDEFDRLARNLNRMLDRIEQLMEGLRQVSSDIAHDLRTPLARLRQGLDTARRGALSAAAYETAIDRAISETDDILSTFGALLRIAQIEAGEKRGGFGDVDLSELVARLRDAYAPVAEDDGKTLHGAVQAGLVIQGDRELLTQLLANLIENAIRHTPAGTVIELAATAGAPGPVCIVADNGPGIPEEMRGKVLERFVRLDRSRSTPGSGLGLALATAVADLHRITLTLEDNRPGLRVRLDFAGRNG